MTTETTTATTGRTIAFRVLAVLGAVFLGGATVVFLVVSFLDEEQEIHLLHNWASVAIFVPLVVVPLLAAMRDPEGSATSFRVALAASAGVVVADAIGGSVASSLITLVVTLALLLLHPARTEVLRLGALDVPLLGLVAIAVIPAVAYGLDQADLQATRPDSDPHVEFNHYAAMADGAFGYMLAGAAAAFRGRGDRLARWLVGLGGAALAASFLAYPDHVSAIDAAWAAAALVVAVLYLAVAEIVARRT
jgi:hypothetical protein